MRAAKRFANRHVPVESHPQMASAAESRMSRTRCSLLLRASSGCNRSGLSSEGSMVDSGRGEGGDTEWRGMHTTLYTRSSLLVTVEDRRFEHGCDGLNRSASAALDHCAGI